MWTNFSNSVSSLFDDMKQPQTDKVFVERYRIETHTDNLNRTKRYVKFVQPQTKLIETLPYYGLQGDGQGTNGILVIYRTKTYPTYISEVQKMRNIIQKLKVTNHVEILEEIQVDDIKRDVKLTLDDIKPLLVIDQPLKLILLVKIQLTNSLEIKNGQVESHEEINDITLLDLFPLR